MVRGWHYKQIIVRYPFEVLWLHTRLLPDEVTVRIRLEGPIWGYSEMVSQQTFNLPISGSSPDGPTI